MAEVRNWRVEGEALTGLTVMKFAKEVRALSAEEAVEKVYNHFGSKHKLKRRQIKIARVYEVGPEELRDPALRKLALGEFA